MALVSLQSVGIGFTESLFDDISLQIEEGEHICLLGRNGSGKTTLMRLIHGEMPPDRGQLTRSQGLKTALLTQEIPRWGTIPVRELLAGRMDHSAAWPQEHRLERVLSELKLPGDSDFETLSSGLKRRALLAAALLEEPDLLMLDEPTNHLDIDSISWLEEFLRSYAKAVLVVTHDRRLVRGIAGRIIEIDLGRLFDWKCDFDTFQKRKEEALAADEQRNRRFDQKLSQEEIWIRQGIKARRTRNEGRVRALMAMREERLLRRVVKGQVKMVLQEGKRSGELVVQAKEIDFGYDENHLISGFSTTIMRGDRIGIVGPNGCGKSTLIRLLLGELHPATGVVELGSGVEKLYYDQQRQQLDEGRTVWENVADGNDHVLVNGRTLHVVAYLQRFLFDPQRMRIPVVSLSGGERGRLLLARLFTRRCNLLVLDEPTNDLDVETLELLEELLLEFSGTLIVISHDRDFINNVVTSLLVFEGEREIREYVGGYDDWLRQRPADKVEVLEEKKTTVRRVKTATKLSNREERDLAMLPGMIEEMETRRNAIVERLSEEDFYRGAPDEVLEANRQLERLAREIDDAFARWQELEDKRQRFQDG